MVELFKGVPRLKKSPAQIAGENPSLWLGLLPVIGGAVTTPMQLGEINRATVYQSAAVHFLKLLAVHGVQGTDSPSHSLSQQLRFSGEPAEVLRAHAQRLERQRRLVTLRPPGINVALLQRKRAVQAVMARRGVAPFRLRRR